MDEHLCKSAASTSAACIGVRLPISAHTLDSPLKFTVDDDELLLIDKSVSFLFNPTESSRMGGIELARLTTTTTSTMKEEAVVLIDS